MNDLHMEAILKAIERMEEAYDLLADYGADPADIDKEEIPRPPKRIEPVNKANYTYNRPQRRARSSCHTIKR